MIGIITYDFPHKKTQDLISNLLIKGYKDLLVLATPFVERENYIPLYIHRPNKYINIPIDELCKNLNIKLLKCSVNELSIYFNRYNLEHILIAGAGILPKEILKKHKIINSHPAYLPNIKGLDAFKWAIYNEQPIGVTTHYISENVDEGLLIERKIIPIYFEDTFHSVAYRQYEMEIEMLVNSLDIVKSIIIKEKLIDNNYKTNMRMPHHLEIIMMNKFKKIIEKSSSFIESKNYNKSS